MPPSHTADANHGTTAPAGTACTAGVAPHPSAVAEAPRPSSLRNEGVLAGDDSDEEMPDATMQLLCMGLLDQQQQQQQNHSSPTAGLDKQGGSTCRPPVSQPVQAGHFAKDPARRQKSDSDGMLSIECRPATRPGVPRPHAAYGSCLLEVPATRPGVPRPHAAYGGCLLEVPSCYSAPSHIPCMF